MSLTSMLKGKSELEKELQRILRENIPSKKQFYTLSGNAAFSNEYKYEAPYKLTNSYYSSEYCHLLEPPLPSFRATSDTK
ncbi:hypothetical protein ACTWQB_14455 [Piscibacillus sp. B03]|uniref:hypothetical protein n=1 Tax=Piscibacillus sp. B03 TaxID=3457430 RepID=UPI003FCE8B37